MDALSPADLDAPAPVWHALDAGAVLARLGVDPAVGLAPAEVEARRARHGRNELPAARRRSVAAMLWSQLADFMIAVLAAAAVISGLLGEWADAAAILAIVVLNAALGVAQEWRAERAMAALKTLASPQARVRRAGGVATIAAADLVPGDIVLLEAGMRVPADLRLLEASALRTDEAALTGESVPVDKQLAAAPAHDAPVGERYNLAHMGTLVTHGRAVGVIVATGLATELGRVATLLAGAERPASPLQQRLARFGRRLAYAVLAICAVIFAVGMARGEAALAMFLTAVSLAVAAIPEALPAVVAIALAVGAYRMSREAALIRRLPAVETLGSVTFICSDKTGTLTANRMRVERIEAASAPAQERLLRAAALNNDAQPGPGGAFAGDPTEVALLEAAQRGGVHAERWRAKAPRVGELPFDSERKRMTTVHRIGHESIAIVKGAPESVLPLCVRQAGATGEEPLADVWRAEAEALAAAGLRVLAFAEKRVHGDGELDADLTLLGLIGLLDPPRENAAAAVAECRSAGIAPVMITGDHPATALAIARRVGIAHEPSQVMTGRELATLSDAELAARIEAIRVYARVDPAQKIRIVEALQARGECVAMTGDGVNDAPALKRADIGVAMGLAGTDVAREAAAIVLLDDNFATIVRAVREGRRIYDNVRKFVRYALTGNAGEIWTIFLAPFAGLPLPLAPIHILWVNLVTDGLPGVALSAEPAEPDVMRRPPRPRDESLFARGLWQHVVWVGLLIGAVSLLAYAWGQAASGGDHRVAASLCFTVLAFAQLAHVLAIRIEIRATLARGFFANRWLLLAVGATLAVQFAILYVPWLNVPFKTAPLAPRELALALALAALVYFAVEAEKWAVRRGWLYRAEAAA
ncbi:MAG: ATPase [Betaproteobacteria bacterium]|jgi:Ca2+-transporting ATPase|nr:MAG: ATPase [Betaproteobacteria bacterium]